MLCLHLTSLVVQMLKNLPAVQETQVRSLGWDYPLEEDMPTHSSIPPWRIPSSEEPGKVQLIGSEGVRHGRETNTSFDCEIFWDQLKSFWPWDSLTRSCFLPHSPSASPGLQLMMVFRCLASLA